MDHGMMLVKLYAYLTTRETETKEAPDVQGAFREIREKLEALLEEREVSKCS